MPTQVHRQSFGVPAEELFAWHERPGAFQRLAPPWERMELLEQAGGIRDGARLRLLHRKGPLRLRWEVEHRNYVAGRQFQDVALRSPFPQWEHTHRVLPAGRARCVLEDELRYTLPGGFLSGLLAGTTRQELDRLFRYRHDQTLADLSQHQRFPGSPMHVAITGSSGLIGSTLTPFLQTGGHDVTRLVRRAAGEGEAQWDPASGMVEPGGIDGVDAVVHLAGENIAARWTDAVKKEIRDSRVGVTERLCQHLARRERKPSVLVCASAIGYYGDRGEESLDEQSAPGTDFLSELCVDWEKSTQPARDAGIRVVNLRIGVVLDPRGGALAKMLTPFRMGLGGRVGSGRQWWSWIGSDDVVGAVLHVLGDEQLAGPVVCTAPQPVRNAEFTKVLGRVLRRPAWFPMPAFAARLAFGQMADELLLASTRALPGALQRSGYGFRHTELEHALRHMLGRNG